jgi:hypothetical protein
MLQNYKRLGVINTGVCGVEDYLGKTRKIVKELK